MQIHHTQWENAAFHLHALYRISQDCRTFFSFNGYNTGRTVADWTVNAQEGLGISGCPVRKGPRWEGNCILTAGFGTRHAEELSWSWPAGSLQLDSIPAAFYVQCPASEIGAQYWIRPKGKRCHLGFFWRRVSVEYMTGVWKLTDVHMHPCHHWFLEDSLGLFWWGGTTWHAHVEGRGGSVDTQVQWFVQGYTVGHWHNQGHNQGILRFSPVVYAESHLL